ncbi:MAG: YIP1 family protein [Desulfocucumaceae bacterium]
MMDSDLREKDHDNVQSGLSGSPGDVSQDSGADEVKEKEELKAAPGFLELIYGILFDPVKTFKRIADPLSPGRAALIFSIVKILTVSILWYTLSSDLGAGDMGLYDYRLAKILMAMIPIIIIGALILEYLKWFIYSGILHLLADLIGGAGRAAGVLATTGLAALPALLFLPVQIFALLYRGNGISELTIFFILIVVQVWGFVLVVFGLRETQRLSTGQAVLVALIPAISIVLLGILFIILLVSMAIPMSSMMK